MVFSLNFCDSKFPHVFRTLLSILDVFNNAVVWMVSTRPLISNSSSSCTNLLATVPRAPITIGGTDTFMFHSFFNSQARSRYLSSFSLYFSFTPQSAERAKSRILRVLLFYWLLQNQVVWLRFGDPFISQNLSGVSFSRTDSGLSIYHLFA